VCEIFQWKSTLVEDLKTVPIEKIFSEKEWINIGEEVSDVFIYTTRLCDVCGIDLAKAVFNELNNIPQSSDVISSSSTTTPWHSLDFNEVADHLNEPTNQIAAINSPRTHRSLCFHLQSQVGKVCHLFGSYPEIPPQQSKGLPTWRMEDRNLLASLLASICLIVFTIALISNKSISQCVSDKFAKNEAKYPADLCRDSSAKYTAYVKPSPSPLSSSSLTSLASLYTWQHALTIVCIGGLCFALGSRYAK